MTKAKIIAMIGMGGIAYLVWAFMAWQDPSQRPDFLKANIAIFTGIVGLALRDMQNPTDPTPPAIDPPNSPAP